MGAAVNVVLQQRMGDAMMHIGDYEGESNGAVELVCARCTQTHCRSSHDPWQHTFPGAYRAYLRTLTLPPSLAPMSVTHEASNLVRGSTAGM